MNKPKLQLKTLVNPTNNTMLNNRDTNTSCMTSFIKSSKTGKTPNVRRQTRDPFGEKGESSDWEGGQRGFLEC